MNQSQEPVHPLERPPQRPQPPPQPSLVVVARPETVQPILTYVLLVVNVIVFGLDWLLGNQLIVLGAKDNSLIANGQLWLLVTPIFLHAGVMHLAVNSYSLFVLGPSIERYFGHARFLALYLLSGVAGTIASFALTPLRSIGASGAIFGLAGALLPFLYRNRHVFGERARQRLFAMLRVIVINLVFGVLAVGIDNWNHLGGLFAGLAAAWFMTPVYEVQRALDGQSITLEDTTPPHQPWMAVMALGAFLAMVIFGLILLRRW